MTQSKKTNNEGLTFAEWLAAAGYEDTAANRLRFRIVWRAGEDPCEFRAERSFL